jgi:hypothetical protein
MVDSKVYFEQWWENGTHGWKPSEKLAEYRLAQDAFIAGVDFACDKIECAPESRDSTEKADNTGSPKCPPSCFECPLAEICNVHNIGSSLCANVWRSLRASA